MGGYLWKKRSDQGEIRWEIPPWNMDIPEWPIRNLFFTGGWFFRSHCQHLEWIWGSRTWCQTCLLFFLLLFICLIPAKSWDDDSTRPLSIEATKTSHQRNDAWSRMDPKTTSLLLGRLGRLGFCWKAWWSCESPLCRPSKLGPRVISMCKDHEYLEDHPTDHKWLVTGVSSPTYECWITLRLETCDHQDY